MTTSGLPASPATNRSATVVLPEPVPPAIPNTNMPEDYTPGAAPGVCSGGLLAGHRDVELLDRPDAGISERPIVRPDGAAVEAEAGGADVWRAGRGVASGVDGEGAAGSVGGAVAGEIDSRDLLADRAGERDRSVLGGGAADDDVGAHDVDV